jgi:hypothetical protein
MTSRWTSVLVSSLRAVSLVAIGVVAGSLMVQGTIARQSPEVAPQAATTRWASCPMMGFIPETSSSAYLSASDFSRRGDTGVHYHCAVELPDRATITGVRFTVLDTRDTGRTGPCYLGRVTLTGTSAAPVAISSLKSTSVAGASGRKILSTTTISHGVVDNSRYGYWFDCEVPAVFLATGYAGIYGAAVSYKP